MSSTALAKTQEKLKSMREHYARKRREEKSVVRSVTHTAVSSLTAFGFSYFKAKFPENSEVFGAPVDLIAGGLGIVGELLGFGGSESDLIGAAGGGALNSYAAAKGTEMGASK